MAFITSVQFEHYLPQNTLGVQETKPRLSWRFNHASGDFHQEGYEVEISEESPTSALILIAIVKHTSSQFTFVPWPHHEPLRSRQAVSVRVRAWDTKGVTTPWSDPARLEVGLLDRADWRCVRLTAPWAPQSPGPDTEHLYRKEFLVASAVARARLYITSQGLYEAELNGRRVGDHFLAPGWTSYEGRLQYQTYDVTSMLSTKGARNCLGVRVAEGWYSGRIGFAGDHQIWGPYNTLLAQLEITYTDSRLEIIPTDNSWVVTRGPIRLAEIYDGEKYDATKEISDWSSPATAVGATDSAWVPALTLSPLPYSTELSAGFSGPIRRVDTVKPIRQITSPAEKTIIDFGQNLVGHIRLTNIKGPRGHKITLRHAEVLENGELSTRPLRNCKATDEYTLRGAEKEFYEPRFTYHGFRFAQVDGWSGCSDLMASIEAVVCHTDMQSAGSFSCSEPLLNKLYQNTCWSMRGNLLSVPTDCPQRDERLGFTGDIALFVPAATFIYDCFSILRNWLIDVAYDQGILEGVPPMMSPNALLRNPVWSRRVPCAIWGDATIIVPWELYQESGDTNILAEQYSSMKTWLSKIPKINGGRGHLWNPTVFQPGDWLDPAAPPHAAWRSATDPKLVADSFLVRSLDLMTQIAGILGRSDEETCFEAQSRAARAAYQAEYVSANGRVASDSQTAYALAISFDLLLDCQRTRAGKRLADLVRMNKFTISTGFAGTPFICEALARTGHIQVAYSMLLEKSPPSWLYPVTMGATTIWERWDSMLPDGSINVGMMTSFNHYTFGAISKFLYERLAGLQRLDAGWKRCRVAPTLGADFLGSSASHLTPRGLISCSWETSRVAGNMETMKLKVSVPHGTNVEIVLPEGSGEKMECVGPGKWEFETRFERDFEWPVEPLVLEPGPSENTYDPTQ